MKLELQKICKSFTGKEILKEVSFSAHKGRALGLLGRNGAGKTTTIRILMHVFRPDSGVFLVDGKPFERGEHRIGYLPEERGMYGKVGLLDQLVYFGVLKGMNKKDAEASAKAWLERVGLTEHLKKPMNTLSKGNQQKVQVIQVLLDDPEILILDEPFSGLDPVNARVLKDIILEFIKRDKLVIFSSHQMGLVEEFCDDIALIRQGEILYHGDLDALKASKGANRFVFELEECFDPQALAKRFDLDLDIREGACVFAYKEKAQVDQMLLTLLQEGKRPLRFGPYTPSLEHLFIEMDEQATKEANA